MRPRLDLSGSLDPSLRLCCELRSCECLPPSEYALRALRAAKFPWPVDLWRIACTSNPLVPQAHMHTMAAPVSQSICVLSHVAAGEGRLRAYVCHSRRILGCCRTQSTTCGLWPAVEAPTAATQKAYLALAAHTAGELRSYAQSSLRWSRPTWPQSRPNLPQRSQDPNRGGVQCRRH